MKNKTEEQAVFQIEDIQDENPKQTQPGIIPVGTILMEEDGNWTAACPSISQTAEGVGPFYNLNTDALWLVNQSYDVVRTLKDANKEISLNLSGWMRIELEEAAEEWGLPPGITLQNAEMMSTVMERVLRLSLETLSRARMTKDVNHSTILKRVIKSPSLATGIRNIVSSALEATTPTQNRVRRAISETMVYGASNTYAATCEDDEMLLTCRIPRLTHAYRVSREKVPEAGKWQNINITEGAPIEEFLPKLMKEVKRPMILYGTAKLRPGKSHDYYDLWVKPNQSAIKRMAYTMEEVEALLPRYTFTDTEIYTAPGWKSPVTGHLIDCLLQATGGRKVASSAWSAGVAAENILCAGMRKAGMKAQDIQPPEAPWMLMYDRMMMREPVEMLIDSGATLVRAYAGGITVKIPKDHEMISMMCNIMWDTGLVISVGTARRLAAMGIHLPADARTFGGAQDDILSAIASHGGKRNVVWRLDEIIDNAPAERAEAFASVFS